MSENLISKESLIAPLEALLFIYGEPMAYKKIAQVLKVNEYEVKDAVRGLEENLKQETRGLSLVIDKEKIQLVTKGEFKKISEEIIKEELNENLTTAALETLSIVIYSAPISRAEIEYIRGVNSSFILRGLLIRGLIERSQDPKCANAFVYHPSFEFLKHLGIGKSEDLPEFEKFQGLIKSLRAPAGESSTQNEHTEPPQQPS